MQKNVILMERLVLQALNFDLNVVHPYNYCYTKSREFRSFLSEDVRSGLLQSSINFLNDR